MLRLSVNEFQEAGGKSCDIVRLTLPYDEGFPPESAQIHQFDTVALHVFVEFLLPEGGACFRRGGPPATNMPVPETAMNKNDLPARRKTDVGCSGKIGSMQAVAVAETAQQSPDGELGTSIPRTDTGHVGAAL